MTRAIVLCFSRLGHLELACTKIMKMYTYRDHGGNCGSRAPFSMRLESARAWDVRAGSHHATRNPKAERQCHASSIGGTSSTEPPPPPPPPVASTATAERPPPSPAAAFAIPAVSA